MNKQIKYDFAGWVTKNDIKCADGVTIKHDAFKENHGKRVPLVWNHDYQSPNNVLGYMELENHPTKGVYGYGYLNGTEEAKNAKELICHGDINSMSIGARKIKRSGSDVIHGNIYEVSLVLAGANPGAKIDSVITHAEDGDSESAIIHNGLPIVSADAMIDIEEIFTQAEEQTFGDVIDTMTPEQQEAVYGLIGLIVDNMNEPDDQNDEEKGDDTVKQNVFNNLHKDDPRTESLEVLRHSYVEALEEAARTNTSFKKVLATKITKDDLLKHGINSIEMLFPDAYASTNGNVPILYKDPNTQYEKILGQMTKSPFSRIKTMVADLTEAEARAKGYIKGTMKKEEYFSLIKRVTTPTTVYKKQKLDRDDIIDITDFDVTNFMRGEIQMMLKEEIVRAALISDGRDVADPDKISETNIRPIITDHEFFTIQKTYTNAADFVDKFLLAMAEYRGTGMPSLYIDPALLTAIKLLKGTDNRYLFGDIPSTAAIAARLDVADIIPTSFMSGKGAVVVNLADYTLGATRGGQITNFDDFDIDYNQYKYLAETRLCGALTMPKSAIYFNTAVITGADATKGGVTFGEREADKLEP